MTINTNCAEYLLEEFSNEDTIREYLYTCPTFAMSQNTICLLYKALQILQTTASTQQSLVTKPNIKAFIDNTFTFFISVYPSMQNISPLMYLIYRITLISPEIKVYLLKTFKLLSFINSLTSSEYMQHYLDTIPIKYEQTTHNILKLPQQNNKQFPTIQQQNDNALCKQYLLLLYSSIAEHPKYANDLTQYKQKNIINNFLQWIKNINDRTSLHAFAKLMNTLITINRTFDEVFCNMFKYILSDVYNKMNIMFYSLKLMRMYLERDDEYKQQRIKQCFTLFISNVNNIRKNLDEMNEHVYLMSCDFILEIYLYANDVYVRAKENKMIRKLIQGAIDLIEENEGRGNHNMNVQRRIRYVMFMEGVLYDKNVYEDVDKDLRDYEFKEGMKVWYNGSQYDVIGCANEKVLIGKDGKDGMWVNTDNNGLTLSKKEIKEQTEK